VGGNITYTNGVGTENTTLTLNGGTLNMGGFNIGSATTVVGSGAGSLNFQAGTLSNLLELNGGAVLTKTTAGTLILEGTNTYSGVTLISTGTLQIGSGVTTGTLGSNSVTNNGTLDFKRSNTYTVTNDISGTGTVVQSGSGTTILTGNNSYGNTNITGGTLNAGSANALGTTGTISFGGGTLQYSSNNNTDYSSRFSTAAGQAYNIDTNGQNVTYATGFSSAGGSLNKLGAGSLTLQGTTNLGAGSSAAVSAGALSVNGVLTASTVTVAGTLQGIGTVNGTTTIGSTGTLSPGSSVGTLTFNNDLSLTSGSTFVAEITNATTYDQVIINSGGSINLGGSTLSFSINAGYVPDQFDRIFIVRNDSAGASGTFTNYAQDSSIAANLNGGQSLFISYTGDFTTGAISGGNDVVIYATPEPHHIMFICVGVLGLGLLIRRRWFKKGELMAAA